jgi:hypothetical protein
MMNIVVSILSYLKTPILKQLLSAGVAPGFTAVAG